jgi:hypothetical protein
MREGMKRQIFVIRTLVKLTFAVATTGCLPGVVLSQVAASFSDSTVPATFSNSTYFSGSADFSASGANYYGSSSSSGAGRGGSALRRQTLQSRAYSPSTISASQYKLTKIYGVPSSAFQVQTSSSSPQMLNPRTHARIAVPHATQSLGLGASNLAQSGSPDLPSSPSQSSGWDSNQNMSILKRLRGASVSGSTHSPRSQKFDRTQSTRSHELKSLMGISNQP